jgi:4'-phosphopantetheinyl transferase
MNRILPAELRHGPLARVVEGLDPLPGEVQVLCFSLDPEAGSLARLQGTLCEEELVRATRFRFPRDRRRYVAARGTVRTVLGSYLGVGPGEVRFRYGQAGKPALELPAGFPDLRFNLSHSGDLGLLAVTFGREVGVDVEQMRAVTDLMGIAKRWFAEGEWRAIASLPPARQAEAFFACWTRKEAYLKARGWGIGAALERFEVSVAPAEPAALLRDADDPEAPLRWILQELTPAEGYLAALAVERRPVG